MDSIAHFLGLLSSVALMFWEWLWALPLPAQGVLGGLVLIILLRALWRRRSAAPDRPRVDRGARLRGLLPAVERRNWIIVDGSNVLYWGQAEPSLAPLLAVLRDIEARGFVAILWFDANAGYLLENRYADEYRMARKVGIKPQYVFIAPKGTPADPLILYTARELTVPVITNDRYRDWATMYPEVLEKGRLISGRIDSGYAILNMPSPAFLAKLQDRVAEQGA